MNDVDARGAESPLSEAPLFFGNDGSRLFGVLYRPSDGAGQTRQRGIVFCAPFAEEAGISLKVLVNYARYLASRGFHVLRFDYGGDGDSQGEFEDATFASRVSDIRRAVELLRGSVGERVGLFGLRVGANLALTYSAVDPGIESLVLWEPILDLRDYVRRFVRIEVVTENSLAGRTVISQKSLLDRLERGETVDVLGHPLSAACFRDFCGQDLSLSSADGHAPALVVGLGRRRSERSDLETFLRVCQRGNPRSELVRVDGRRFWTDPNDPTRELESWYGHDELFRTSAQWLESIYADGADSPPSHRA